MYDRFGSGASLIKPTKISEPVPYSRLISRSPEKRYEVRELKDAGRIIQQVYFSHDLLSSLLQANFITQREFDAGRRLQELQCACPHQPNTTFGYRERFGREHTEPSDEELERWAEYLRITRRLPTTCRSVLLNTLVYNHRVYNIQLLYKALERLVELV